MELNATTVFVLNLVFLFVIKVIDNIISTSKTILVQKNKGFLAALTVIVSQVIFYKLIDAVGDQGDLAMYIVAIASGIGTFLALKLSDKFSKERTYINVIMSDDISEMKALRDFLKEHKITNVATDSYTKDWERTLTITAYADTKDESKLLDRYLESRNTKFKRIVDKA